MTEAAPSGAGFTLIEVLVALAIVALSFGLAFDGLSGALERIGRSHERTAAMLVAQSTLDRVGRDILLSEGRANGVTPDGFAWLVEAAPYDADQVPRSGPLAGYLIKVTVGWTERGRPRQASLATVRLEHRDPPA